MTVQHLATVGSGPMAGQLQQGWVFAGENPILRFDASGAGSIRYYLEDANDSIATLVGNQRGNVSAPISSITHYKYDGFGLPVSGSGLPTSAAGGDFGFHAAWLDSGTKLYGMRARTYDAKTGRFTTPDPVEPDALQPETYHSYVFANNNPHLFSDPTGLFSLIEINVSASVQTSLDNFKAAAVNQAKEFAIDQVQELGVSLLKNLIGQFVPGSQYLDELANLKGSGASNSFLGNRFEQQLTGYLQDFFKDVPFADKIWLQPQVSKTTGIAANNGLNLALGGAIDFSNNHPRPDFIIRDGLPINDRLSSWLIGDVKLSVSSVFFSVAVKKSSQFQAIAKHATDQSVVPVALYITLRGSKITEGQRERIRQEAHERGVSLLILSLLDQ